MRSRCDHYDREHIELHEEWAVRQVILVSEVVHIYGARVQECGHNGLRGYAIALLYTEYTQEDENAELNIEQKYH